MSESKITQIRDITTCMRNINLQFIILEIGPPRRTRDGHDVRLIRVADKTGSVNLSAWDDIGGALNAGDICKLVNGYASIYRGSLTVNCGKLGELIKIGEFCMLFSPEPNLSATIHPDVGSGAKRPPTMPEDAAEGPVPKQGRAGGPVAVGAPSTSTGAGWSGRFGDRPQAPVTSPAAGLHGAGGYAARTGGPARGPPVPPPTSSTYNGYAAGAGPSAMMKRVSYAAFRSHGPPPPLTANGVATASAAPGHWYKQSRALARN